MPSRNRATFPTLADCISPHARAVLQRTTCHHARAGQRRTLDADELGDWVDYICQNDGPERLTTYRQRAEELAPQLGVDSDHLALLQSLVGIALGTRPHEQTTTRPLVARRQGNPVDQIRVRRFELLGGHPAASCSSIAPSRHGVRS